jgi:hypothetical protein
MKVTHMEPDIQVENHGSIIMFRPMTDEATDWLNEHVESEGWQWFGGALAVEPRYAGDLADGARADGLEVQ